MSPAEIVEKLEALGVGVTAAGSKIALTVSGDDPPRALLDEMTREKAAVLTFLRGREAPAPVIVRDRRAPATSARPTLGQVVIGRGEPGCPTCQPWEAPTEVLAVRPFTPGEVAVASGVVPRYLGSGLSVAHQQHLAGSFTGLDRIRAFLRP